MNLLFYYLLQSFGVVLMLGVGVFLFITLRKRLFALSKKVWIGAGVLLIAVFLYFLAAHPYPPHFAMPPFMNSHAPGSLPASIPVFNVVKFLLNPNRFERVEHIGRDPSDLPPSLPRRGSAVVKISLTAKEVLGQIADGVYYNYWTYNGQVPGPFLRVRQGDTIEFSLSNDASSMHAHNIDLHAVTGPGGGAKLTNVEPGEKKMFQWKALNPGLYEYHCAMPNVSTHNAHGQYGLILVEPPEGLPKVDHEFYVMQGEFYTLDGLGRKGLVSFDPDALIEGVPSYIPFNGTIDKTSRIKVKTGERIRFFVGNGGVNLVSSFHVIGEIFDIVYPEAAIGSQVLKNVQTTAVLPGGATIVEFTPEVPGTYLLVDHALARMNKGAWMLMEVSGEKRDDLFKAF